MWNETALMNIILGVTASIAPYKAADIASKLTKQNRSVHVVMTAGATQFVTPLTLQTLSRHPVTTNILRRKDELASGAYRSLPITPI
jgi:phosphopantothenoylcysteine decarboxylase/phosphopantothenoylcysteine decarboxylase/phosphopantothenate--cysteine ligase